MYTLRPPDPRLARVIEHYWWVVAPPQGVDLTVDVFVDARADLILNYGAAYTRTGPRGAQTLADPNLDAQRDHPIRIHQAGAVRVAGVRFRAGGLAPFLVVPADTLTGRTVAPADALGPGALALVEALRLEDDPDRVKARFDAFFLGAWGASQGLGDPAGLDAFFTALDAIQLSAGAATIDAAAAQAGVSVRHAHRLFARYLGLGPKVFARVARFQTALQRLRSETRPLGALDPMVPGAPLADLAHACGYYDQPHLVREFRRFTGAPPSAWRGYYPPDAPVDFAPNVIRYE